MIRVARIAKDELTPKALDLARSLEQINSELSSALGREVASSMCFAQEDGDYINYYSNYEGHVSQNSLGDGGASEGIAKEHTDLFADRVGRIHGYLKGEPNLPPACAAHRDDLLYFLEHARTMAVMDNSLLSLLPTETKDRPLYTPPPPAPPKPWYKRLWPLLTGLALAALLGYTLCPENTGQELPDDTLEGMDGEEGDDEALKLNRIIEDRAMAALYRNLLDDLEDLDKEEEVPPPEPKQAEEPPRPSPAPAPAVKKAAAKKGLPKCRDMKKTEFPQMIIDFDSSNSMNTRDVPAGGLFFSRMVAAKSAARDIVGKIDKNVAVGLIEINGCPNPINRGYYSGANRNALLGTIANIHTRRNGDGGTPLVNSLRHMSGMVDGVNRDAVGILITDGVDTCPLTKYIDLCSIATTINYAKPRFKIHVVLIGEDAPDAACVASITGGKVYSPRNAAQMAEVLQDASSSLTQVCTE